MPRQPHRDPVQPDRAGKVMIARSKLGSAPRAQQRQGVPPLVPSALDLPLFEDLLPQMRLVRDLLSALACTYPIRRTRKLTRMKW